MTTLHENPDLTIDELVALYDANGWSAYTNDPESLKRGVDNSAFVVIARSEGQLIGLARGLSDGETIFYLQDILVHPAYHRQGIGRMLLERCMERYAHCRQLILLTDDDPGQREFYEAMGFRNTRETELNCFVKMRES